jgi:hypothetical protein
MSQVNGSDLDIANKQLVIIHANKMSTKKKEKSLSNKTCSFHSSLLHLNQKGRRSSHHVPSQN